MIPAKLQNQNGPCVLCTQHIPVNEKSIEVEYHGWIYHFCQFCWKQGEECGGIHKLIEIKNKIKGIDSTARHIGEEIRNRRKYFLANKTT